VFGDFSQESVGCGQDLRPLGVGQRGVQRLDFRCTALLLCLEVTADSGHGVLGADHTSTGGQSFRTIEVFMSEAKFTSARLGPGHVPRFGNLAVPPQSRAADLVPSKILDSLECSSGLTGVKIRTNLVGDPIGQTEPGGCEGIGRSSDPFGKLKVVDCAGQVVGRASAIRPGYQIQPESAAKLYSLVVVCYVRTGRQGIGLIISACPGGFLGLPQDDPPMSQHG
jgi:hypothetical protein